VASTSGPPTSFYYGHIETLTSFDEEVRGRGSRRCLRAGRLRVTTRASVSPRWRGTRARCGCRRGCDRGAGAVAGECSAGGRGQADFRGGEFTSAGGIPAQRIAEWDGVWWRTLGQGLNGTPYAMCEFNDGSGPALYVGGAFTSAGGEAAGSSRGGTGARGRRWGRASTTSCTRCACMTMAVARGCTRGGRFTWRAGRRRWGSRGGAGGAWSSVGSGAGNHVDSLCVYDDGAGPRLYAGGKFTWIGGVSTNLIAAWDGATWSALAAQGLVGGNPPDVAEMAVYDDGSGPALFVTGSFIRWRVPRRTRSRGTGTGCGHRWAGAAARGLRAEDQHVDIFSGIGDGAGGV
jgi:hypothetical protein